MLKETYTYSPLERVNVNGSRHYQTPGGQPLPSVTTVLSALKDKTQLHEWRKRVGDEEADRIMRLATGIGTQVHLHLEKFILEENRPEGTNLIHQMAKELSDIVIREGLSRIPFALYTRGIRQSPVEAIPHDAAFDEFEELPGILSWLCG